MSSVNPRSPVKTLRPLRLWLRTTRPWTFWVSVILLGVPLTTRGAEIIACGGSRVVIFDANQPEGANPKLTWSWDVKEATTLPPQYEKLLVPLDECRPVRTNTQSIA